MINFCRSRQKHITLSFRLRVKFELELFRCIGGCDGNIRCRTRYGVDGLKSQMKKTNSKGGVEFVSIHTTDVDYGFRYGRRHK